MSKTNKKDIKKNQMELLGMKNKCLKLKKKQNLKGFNNRLDNAEE